MNRRPKIIVAVLALAWVLAWTGVVSACPTCKDSLANDPASASLVRGYAYSILFMLSMPPLIFSGLSAYFYWEVCKAKSRQVAMSNEPKLAPLPR